MTHKMDQIPQYHHRAQATNSFLTTKKWPESKSFFGRNHREFKISEDMEDKLDIQMDANILARGSICIHNPRKKIHQKRLEQKILETNTLKLDTRQFSSAGNFSFYFTIL